MRPLVERLTVSAVSTKFEHCGQNRAMVTTYKLRLSEGLPYTRRHWYKSLNNLDLSCIQNLVLQYRRSSLMRLLISSQSILLPAHPQTHQA